MKETTQKIQHPGLIISDSERLVMRWGADTEAKRHRLGRGGGEREMNRDRDKDRESRAYMHAAVGCPCCSLIGSWYFSALLSHCAFNCC